MKNFYLPSYFYIPCSLFFIRYSNRNGSREGAIVR